MSPEERQLLQGLFDRMRTNAAGPRDREAEQMINESIRQQPYAPYLLAQTVIVQDQALQAANDRLQQLEQQLHEQQSQPQGGGFLSGLFGGGSSAAPPPPPQQPSSVWNRGGTAPQGGGYAQGGGYPQGGYAPQPQQGGPWGGGFGGGGFGGGGFAGGAPQGGGFLSGALSTAAGVAGGVLMADSIRSLFSHGGAGSNLGIASGVPGMGGDTINNFFGNSASAADRQQDAQQDLAGDWGSQSGHSAADTQQDADQDQDFAQDMDDYSTDV